MKSIKVILEGPRPTGFITYEEGTTPELQWQEAITAGNVVEIKYPPIIEVNSYLYFYSTQFHHKTFLCGVTC